MKRFTIQILVLAGLIGFGGEASAQLADKELVTALQKGGYVMYMRHPKTHPDQADTDPLNFDNVKAQRHLTDEGRKDAQDVGKTLKALSIPVDRVISSKFYRAHEAAKLLGVGEVTISPDVTEGGQVVSPNENNRRTKALRNLLATAPAAGKNTIIVAHKPNIVDAAGKDFLDIGEGEVAIFQPLGDGKFKPVARVTVARWSQLAK
jgi:phosphohistidine phosphatase SixA